MKMFIKNFVCKNKFCHKMWLEIKNDFVQPSIFRFTWKKKFSKFLNYDKK